MTGMLFPDSGIYLPENGIYLPHDYINDREEFLSSCATDPTFLERHLSRLQYKRKESTVYGLGAAFVCVVSAFRADGAWWALWSAICLAMAVNSVFRHRRFTRTIRLLRSLPHQSEAEQGDT